VYFYGRFSALGRTLGDLHVERVRAIQIDVWQRRWKIACPECDDAAITRQAQPCGQGDLPEAIQVICRRHCGRDLNELVLKYEAAKHDEACAKYSEDLCTNTVIEAALASALFSTAVKPQSLDAVCHMVV
jgi:hypothetical protein